MKVNKTQTLKDYLLSQNMKNSTIKNYFKYHMIYVNNQHAKATDIVKIGDIVDIKKKSSLPFDIIYEDKDMIVINKPNHLLSEQNSSNKYQTAYSIVKQYLSSKHESIYLVHRLDQDTSGILMFIKNKKLYEELTHNWNKYVLKRGYIAIVEGKMDKGTIHTKLQENKAQVVYVSNKGKDAITHYNSIKTNNRYTMLEVYIDTGRKNQIRVHLSYLKHPIIGDKKYGSKINPIKRLGLHAHLFSFRHPFTNKIYTFKCDIPEEFERILK